ncbi:MAG: hypothetical protein MRJ65_01525 [Candidatus Brocadiaceae bacterium]|nr:hypothetical protein [Candidatus Brocadiaceae bacterium]
MKKESGMKCPSCDSVISYKYGKAKTGKKRFLCLVCGKQFTIGAERRIVKDRPDCPECGKAMHVYKREKDLIRFRCSAYPECKIFLKVHERKEDG